MQVAPQEALLPKRHAPELRSKLADDGWSGERIDHFIENMLFPKHPNKSWKSHPNADIPE